MQIAIGDLADPRVVPPRAARRATPSSTSPASPATSRAATIEELNGARHLAAAARRRARRGRALRVLLAARRHAAPPDAPAPRQGARRARRSQAAEPAHDDVRAARSSTRPATAGCAGSSASRCLPAVPLAGRGRARTQPIWAEDVADCVLAALDGRADGARALRAGRARRRSPSARSSGSCCAPRGRRRRARAASRSPVLRAAAARRRGARRARPRSPPGTRRELLGGRDATARGTADAEALGVQPAARWRDGARRR